ncbi:MAG: TetR/AcrR family transcriptional regulator [Ilumatobacteraceae bacterium]
MARRTRPRTPLNRERVLRAAIELADDEGIDSLTMRGLAARLDVEAMSLYNHVANKDDVLDGMVELVAEEIEEPAGDADWSAAVRQRSISAHDALLRHPWSSLLWTSRTSTGPARMRHVDALLRDLREAGFAPGVLDLAFHTLQNHVIGHALQRSSFAFDADDLPRLSAEFLHDFPADDYPDLADHIRYHVEQTSPERSAFEFGLDLILDGLERIRHAG